MSVTPAALATPPPKPVEDVPLAMNAELPVIVSPSSVMVPALRIPAPSPG